MVDCITPSMLLPASTLMENLLSLTCNCLGGTEIAFKVRNRSEMLLMHKNGFRQGGEFNPFTTGYSEEEVSRTQATFALVP